MPSPRFVPYRPPRVSPADGLRRARRLHRILERRRSVRAFSDRPVPRALIEQLVATASTAPSGAHKQPWTFVAVSDPDTKARIREAAEREERINYERRFSEEWKRDLAPLGTDFVKDHLTTAPWVVVVFEQRWARKPDGSRGKHYYVVESVGIAVGMFLAAATVAGLATLTHTPSPMGFLGRLLGRPENERGFAVIPLGYPAAGCRVPDLKRKSLAEVLVVDPAPTAPGRQTARPVAQPRAARRASATSDRRRDGLGGPPRTSRGRSRRSSRRPPAST